MRIYIYYIRSINENIDNKCLSQDIPGSHVQQLVDGLIDILANSDSNGVPFKNGQLWHPNCH